MPSAITIAAASASASASPTSAAARFPIHTAAPPGSPPTPSHLHCILHTLRRRHHPRPRRLTRTVYLLAPYFPSHNSSSRVTSPLFCQLPVRPLEATAITTEYDNRGV
ncbi:uncharacterized protein [Triticum aestivum]|uniref:uncharacterized protein n=1 Tax=Triticum aestivum TaxID=4565 RepID=UPI001D022E45|nr:uncharacterized protein LOC123123992 [Triticum aestivum]